MLSWWPWAASAGAIPACPLKVRPQAVVSCNIFDNNPVNCETAYSRRMKLSGDDPEAACWYHAGECRSGRNWIFRSQMFRVRTHLLNRGCEDWIGKAWSHQHGSKASVLNGCENLEGWDGFIRDWSSIISHCGSNPFAQPAQAEVQCISNSSADEAVGSKAGNRTVPYESAYYAPLWVARNYMKSILDHRCTGSAQSDNTLVVFDKPCNGCAKTSVEASSNIWHRMTRMYTIWTAIKALACAKSPAADCSTVDLPKVDLIFTQKFVWPLGNSSYSGYQALANGGRIFKPKEADERHGTIDWCSYSRVVVVPRSPTLMTKSGGWFDSFDPTNPDKLWSLAFAPEAACLGSRSSDMWQSFVRDLLRGLNVRRQPSYWRMLYTELPGRDTATNQPVVCMLVRGRTKRAWQKRENSYPRFLANSGPATAAVGSICHGTARATVKDVTFDASKAMQEHVQQIAYCDVAIGVHGAQMMNVMFMEAGAAVVEYIMDHRRSPQEDIHARPPTTYYRNVAQLSGLVYMSRRVCGKDLAQHAGGNATCAGFSTTEGVVLRVEPLRSVAMAAIAASAQRGGLYSDAPVQLCPSTEH